MGVSKNRGTPKTSILIGCFIINHPFWGTPIFGNTHIEGTMIQSAHQDEMPKLAALGCQSIGKIQRKSLPNSDFQVPNICWQNSKLFEALAGGGVSPSM